MDNEQNKTVENFFEAANELISMENVSLVYDKGAGAVPAIDNINVNIYPGEFVCVMGPSGCGKSTLLNILAGFIPPTGGTVKLNQTEIKGIDWHRGVVFQQPPLYEWYSVRKNIAFGPMMKKVPKSKIREEVSTYLEKVGLTEFADKKVYELSGGMKQRAAIASALINNPEILLMDEPFGALDALTREQMQGLIRKIWWSSGKTIFFITHDVDEALLLATRILVMSKHPGKIIADLPVHFTKDIVTENSDDTRYTESFHQKRKHILQLINEQ
ncbi:taurine transport system ATP-binding protein [Sporobacter termitidis DSM 10068]|uniref:Taurine transport system ATP-binding protein n=1 Tax=Sporobacter termitidis DSM 10068 TaxID=1123282 RepID=A0A1M5UTT6_9FIRM|nr:ABC transporter ATP-binding protein [Sporobacter termitidis]SHH66457.1 taurine transport system ATP-binding protein [Sporobacter termitidis DSM 10068]